MDLKSLRIGREASVRQAMDQLDNSAKGILLLCDSEGTLERTVTDGDLRRLLLSGSHMSDTLDQLPPKGPVTIDRGYTRRAALALMQEHEIEHLPVVDANGKVIELLERSKVNEQILMSVPHMGEAELDYVHQAFHTNWIAPLGPNVDHFEQELAEKVGAEHVVALNSGTAAIHLALRLLEVGVGDTVFVSSFTFVASINPIIYQGAEPVLIDSEPDSWNMSPVALAKALEKASRENRLPKAVVVVSLYGQSADMDPIMELCDHYNIPIIEDAAESLGATYKGRASGTMGKMGIYSFNGNKIITTSGGGALVVHDRELADRARFFATQARDPAPHYQHSSVGYNYRLSNVLAGIGRGQLTVLDERIAARRRIFDTYRTELEGLGWLKLMPEPEWSYSTHWLSTCLVQGEKSNLTARGLIENLSDEFIEVRPVWKPMHRQPVFAQCTYFPHGESVSDRLFEQGICLPSGSNMTQEQLGRVIGQIKGIAST